MYATQKLPILQDLKILLFLFLALLPIFLFGAAASLAFLLPLPELAQEFLYFAAYTSLTLLFAFFLCAKTFCLPLSEFRIPRPSLQPPYMILGVLLPAAVIAALFLYPGTLAANGKTAAECVTILVSAILGPGLSAGIAEEVLFRGLIMTAVEKRWGVTAAVLIPSVLFGALHMIGNNLDVFSAILLLVAGTSVGILFSVIALKSGSVWNSAFVHGMWNTLMIGGIIRFGTEWDSSSIFSYVFPQGPWMDFFTGGRFGIECSLAAIVGYWAAILLVWKAIRPKRS